MSGHTRLWRRGAAYYFRAKVPVDLLKQYSPRREIKFTLNTNDRADAERRVRLESVKLDEEFAALRNGKRHYPGRTVELTKGKPGPVPGPQMFMGEVTFAYFRALAKIGFHYVLTHIPTIVGSEPEFRALREFVRRGTGEPNRFLHRLDTTPVVNGPPGHVLTAVAMPESVTVSVCPCSKSMPPVVIRSPLLLIENRA